MVFLLDSRRRRFAPVGANMFEAVQTGNSKILRQKGELAS